MFAITSSSSRERQTAYSTPSLNSMRKSPPLTRQLGATVQRWYSADFSRTFIFYALLLVILYMFDRDFARGGSEAMPCQMPCAPQAPRDPVRAVEN